MLALLVILFASLQPSSTVADPFAPLAIYDGHWEVRAEHPWSGGASGTVDHLVSNCHHSTLYFTCEQAVNGKVTELIVYTADPQQPGRLHTRFIDPDGLASGRGDLTITGSHWTYNDKPPAPLKGNWSRTQNVVIDHDHIHFEEFESSDEGVTWHKANSGMEQRER